MIFVVEKCRYINFGVDIEEYGWRDKFTRNN
jgi:hypothetical protein